MTSNQKNSKRVHVNYNSALKELMAEEISRVIVRIPESLKIEFLVKVSRNKTDMSKVLLSFIKEYVEGTDE